MYFNYIYVELILIMFIRSHSYISEWETTGFGANSPVTVTSNIRVTTKVAVHALLSKELRDVGSALVYNMVIKEVKTAVSLPFFISFHVLIVLFHREFCVFVLLGFVCFTNKRLGVTTSIRSILPKESKSKVRGGVA